MGRSSPPADPPVFRQINARHAPRPTTTRSSPPGTPLRVAQPDAAEAHAAGDDRIPHRLQPAVLDRVDPIAAAGAYDAISVRVRGRRPDPGHRPRALARKPLCARR